MPGLKIKTEDGVVSQRNWLGSAHGIGNQMSIGFDTADFAANAVDGVIPSGTAVAFNDTTKKYVPFTGTDQAAVLRGFLFDSVPATEGKTSGSVVIFGRVLADNLPEASKTPVKAIATGTGTNGTTIIIN